LDDEKETIPVKTEDAKLRMAITNLKDRLRNVCS